MLRMIAGLVLIVLAAAILFIGWCYWSFDREMRADIRRLLTEAARDRVVVTDAMLSGLPEPAQRYLHHAGVIGKPIPRIVRLQQTGRIRSSTEAGWMDFEAEEIYSTNPPALVWRAFLPRKSLPVAIGRDEYVGGEGSILIKLLAAAPMADEKGPELAAAGLMRYLNEMTGFPAAFLGSNVTIATVDDNSFRVTIADRGMTASGVIIVDAEGQMTNFRAQRFNTGTNSIETWETPINGYATFQEINVPVRGAAVWKLPYGDFTYIEIDIPLIAYDEELSY